MSFNIFISYSSKDIDRIKPISNLLRTIQGTKIFFADETINLGDNINQTIINNIKNSDVFLVFFSDSAIESNYVQQETGMAKLNKIKIIPILLDSNKPTGMLVVFKLSEWRTMVKKGDAFYKRIVENHILLYGSGLK